MDERAFRYVECTIPHGMTASEYLRRSRSSERSLSGLGVRRLAGPQLLVRPLWRALQNR
jgi:hypothetical protein